MNFTDIIGKLIDWAPPVTEQEVDFSTCAAPGATSWRHAHLQAVDAQDELV